MSHLQKAVETATKVADMASDALAGLELATRAWPAEFRVIIWEAVAAIATSRADEAKRRKNVPQ